MGSINMQTCLEETYVLSTDSQSHVFICSIDDVFLWLIQLWDLWFINIVKNIHWVQILHSNSEYRTDSVKKTNHRCLMPMKVELTNFRTIYMEKSQNHRPFPGTRIGGSFARGCPFFNMEKSQYQSLLESEKKIESQKQWYGWEISVTFTPAQKCLQWDVWNLSLSSNHISHPIFHQSNWT